MVKTPGIPSELPEQSGNQLGLCLAALLAGQIMQQQPQHFPQGMARGIIVIAEMFMHIGRLPGQGGRQRGNRIPQLRTHRITVMQNVREKIVPPQNLPARGIQINENVYFVHC